MIALTMGFAQMSMCVRWITAIAASLMLHFAAFTLLNRIILVDGDFSMNAHQTGSALTVNIAQSTRPELPPAQQQTVSNSTRGDTFHQSSQLGTSSAAIVLSSGYLPVSELDVIPVIRRDINIDPDEMSSLPGNGGKVVIGLWIDESGQVVKSELMETELPAGYGEIAAQAFLQAEFQPGIKNGSAVKSRVKVVFVYSPEH